MLKPPLIRWHSSAHSMMKQEPVPETIARLQRPDPALWKYYILTSLLSGPFIIFSLPYLYFRYHTLRYRFDAEGIHMKVGILFQREINLTYARIQDIHLRSGFIQRWLGLANVEVQTASGSTGAELVIEGFKEYEFIRDFLYTRMRGYQSQREQKARPADLGVPGHVLNAETSATNVSANSDVVSLLLAIRDELRQTRESLPATQKHSAQDRSGPAANV
jgi:uncharacterized membrane protein YdbT with pleckstrin-like domain